MINFRRISEVCFIFFWTIAAPTTLYWWAPLEWLHIPFWASIYAMATTLIFNWIGTVCAAWLKVVDAVVGEPHIITDPNKLPPVTAIIAAYLPNERDIVKETIKHHTEELAYPGELQVILAYNTPVEMPIEEDLRQMQGCFNNRAGGKTSFQVLKVLSSRSKAENVNAALTIATGVIVGVFDTDHRPVPDCFQRACYWIQRGYDVVQGKCMIRNGEETWITRLIAVEFENIYCVEHPGRALYQGFAIFGGSNGYWKTDLLRKLQMNKNRLTEDIDVTMRALKIGAKIKYDVDIVSTELAPVTLGAFTNQRLRWAEGWFQVSLHNAIDCITSEYTNLQQKFGFLLLLIWREIFFHIPSHTLIVFVVYCVKSGTVLIGWDSTPFALLSFILPMFSAMFTWTLSNPFIRKHLSWYFWYWLVSYPYATYQTWLGLLGQYRAATKYHKWKVTPRGPSKQKNEENVQEGNVQPQQEDKPPAV